MLNEKENKALLQIDQRSVARVSAVFLIVLLGAFFLGYYMGKRQTLLSGIQTFQKESLADEVYANAFALHGVVKNELNFEIAQNSKDSDADQGVDLVVDDTTEVSSFLPPETVLLPAVRYCAPLIGYSARNKKVGEDFIEKWNARGVHLNLREMKSTNTKGKELRWYQVVVAPHSDKENVKLIAELVSKQERLSENIMIEEC
jgi:hypothetical protein